MARSWLIQANLSTRDAVTAALDALGEAWHAVAVVPFSAARWRPADVVCIDVASSGARFGIVEANCFNAARLYAADPVTVLGAVAAHVGASSAR